MQTKYASAERSDIAQLQSELEFIESIEYVERLINSLPYVGTILNKNREVVFANDSLLEILGLKKATDLLGKRPGEILKCVNADREIGGCGTSENCSVCGAVNCILRAQKESKKVSAECRISARGKDGIVAYEFKVTTSPFIWKDETYYIFSLLDNSSEKRRMAMERIFFHDVINKTGSMYGFINLLKNENDLRRIHKFIDLLESINTDLTYEIKSQRDLLAAENGDLSIKKSSISSLEIVQVSAQQISVHDVATDKTINLDPESDSFFIVSDGTFLRRILMNMLKNALEATAKHNTISIGCKKLNGKYRFWVANESVIPRENQLQIFQRSFSTKGNGRGLGTYSMKLLGEQYLGGKVGFISNEEQGTVFYIDFPSESG